MEFVNVNENNVSVPNCSISSQSFTTQELTARENNEIRDSVFVVRVSGEREKTKDFSGTDERPKTSVSRSTILIISFPRSAWECRPDAPHPQNPSIVHYFIFTGLVQISAFCENFGDMTGISFPIPDRVPGNSTPIRQVAQVQFLLKFFHPIKLMM